MKLLNKDIELVIFDLDGTLIDSTSLWADIDKSFFAHHGLEIPPQYNKEIAHIGLFAAAKLTKDKYLPNLEIEDIMNEWNDLALEAYEKHIPLKDNALELLKILKLNKVKIALATANSGELYLPCLLRLDIEKYFDLIIDVNSCKDGKNSPEIYDKVCAHFSIKRENALVVEDMLQALKTAYENGYNVVGMYDKCSTTNEEENRKYCHKFIYNFDELIKEIN